MDQLNLIAWQGRSDTRVGGIGVQHAAMMHATLGATGTDAPKEGDVIAPLWHWAAFRPEAPMAELGDDGHPKLGAFLPPLRLERRMWAGGALRFRAPIHVGETLRRRSTIRAISEKQGSSGLMVFVTIDHLIYGESGLAVEEQQDIVYLPMPTAYSPPKMRPMPSDPVLHQSCAMPETLLFRYSAVTFNAHRIHYDLPYAQQVEKYPGLVVHGPLQATLLMQAATAHKGRVPSDFHFRGVHPLFAGRQMQIAATEEDGALTLYTGQDGHQGMQSAALWEETV